MRRCIHNFILYFLLVVSQLVAETGLIPGDVVRFWDGASQEEGTITNVTSTQYKLLTDSGYVYKGFDACVKVSHIGMSSSDLVIAIGDLNTSQVHTSTQVLGLHSPLDEIQNRLRIGVSPVFHLDGRGAPLVSDSGFSGFISSDFPLDQFSLLNMGFGASLDSNGNYTTSTIPDMYSGLSQNDYDTKNLGVIAIPNNEGAHIIYQSMALWDLNSSNYDINATLVDSNATLFDINSTLADLLEFFPLDINATVDFPQQPWEVYDPASFGQLANIAMDTANQDDILQGIVDLNQAVENNGIENHMDLEAIDSTLGDEFDELAQVLEGAVLDFNASVSPTAIGEAVKDSIFAEGDARNQLGQDILSDHTDDAEDAIGLIDDEIDSAEGFGLDVTPSTNGIGSFMVDIGDSTGAITSYDLFDIDRVGVSVEELYGWIYGIITVFAYFMYWMNTKGLLADILKTSIQAPDTAPISNHLSIAGCSELNIGLKVTQNLGYLAALLGIFAVIVTGVSAFGGFDYINVEIINILGHTTWTARSWDWFSTLVPVSTILTLTIAYYSVATVAWTGFFGSVRVSRSLS